MAENSTRAIGQDAEELALGHLLSSGLVLIARNFRCRIGEIDLIMRDGNCLVFVEVRFRKASHFASACESVDRRKQRKLLGAAAFFLGRHTEYRQHATRFDVVALDGRSRNTFTLQWVQDAFRPG
ncbi:MAG: YraN family protein [Woeseia sp.]